jgi:hypothetical protein
MPVACQTSDTKIITEEGVLSFREICFREFGDIFTTITFNVSSLGVVN